MEMEKVNEVQIVPQEELCSICEIKEYSTNECPMIPALKEVLSDQANAVNTFSKPYNNPYSNTYNRGKRLTPTLISWRNDNAAQLPLSQPSS